MLDRAGEYINAITLVQCIPPQMEIPQLKEKLVHVLDNYSLELELRQGCNTILTSDMAELYERLCGVIGVWSGVGSSPKWRGFGSIPTRCAPSASRSSSRFERPRERVRRRRWWRSIARRGREG